MRKIHVKATAILEARPEDVYATIADYRNGHPQILSKENLYDLQVEQGGYGAGTVIRFKAKALGVERAMHLRVSEPEPGRVLVEQDVDLPQSIITTFTVTPVEQKSRVEISTIMNASPGLTGLIERIVVPMVNKSAYQKELKLLEVVARKRYL